MENTETGDLLAIVLHRRTFLKGLGISLAIPSLALNAAACGSTGSSTSGKKGKSLDSFTYGIVSYNPLHTVALVASELKLMEKHGIDLKMVLTQSTANGMSALAGGSLDGVAISPDAIFPLVNQGSDAKIILPLALGSPYSLVVRPDIHSYPDLKGKVAGCNGLTTGADTSATRLMMADNGLYSPKDFTVIVVGSVAARLAALKAGSVSVVAELQPETTQVVQAGFTVLDTWLRHPSLINTYPAVVAARPSNYAKRKDVFVRFIQAWIETTKFINNSKNKSAVVGMLSKRLKVDNAEASNTYDSFVPHHAFPDPPLIEAKSMAQVVANVKFLGEPMLNGSTQRSYDNSLVEAALK